MIESLYNNKKQILEQFYRNCGLECADFLDFYTVEELVAGLIFLNEVSFFPPPQTITLATFIHGKDDGIIPVNAGEQLCAHMNGQWFTHDGPHAFFTLPQFQNTIISEILSGKDSINVTL